MEAPTPANRMQNFDLIDSLYCSAAAGDIDKFRVRDQLLGRLLTPNENTILHIYITARPRKTKPNTSWKLSLLKKPEDGLDHGKDTFVQGILEMCPDLLWKANTKGESLLHVAARHGHADIVNMLIVECKRSHQKDQENGVQATRQMLGKTNNEAKDTALHEAVRYNHLDVVKILTEEDPNLRYEANNDGETPLYLAAERGYRDVVEHILSTCESPADDGPIGRTALHAAIIFGDIEITKMLLEKKEALTSKADQRGRVPLHYAAFYGYVNILKALLDTDKSAAYKTDKKGKTALHVAAGRGKISAMKEIISRCPSCCELVDDRGWNVLHFAFERENTKAVELLLENPSLGNLINQKDKKGNTPLLQVAVSRTFMNFFLSYPEVDKQVFNHQNQNVLDINRHVPLFFWGSQGSYIRCLNYTRIYRCCSRIIFPEDEGDEGKDKDNSSDVTTESDDTTKSSKREKKMQKLIEEGQGSRLIVAILIATVTFAAGITLPGGYISEKGIDEGSAVLTSSKAFQAFVISNTMAMILSCCAVLIHFLSMGLPNTRIRCKWLQRANLLTLPGMLAMVLAFVLGTYAVLNRAEVLAVSVWSTGGLFFLGYLIFGQIGEICFHGAKNIRLRHYRKVRREL